MTLSEALSDRHISAMLEAAEIGKDKLGDTFYSATVTHIGKNGFTAIITDKSKRKYMLSVKHDGKLRVVRFA